MDTSPEEQTDGPDVPSKKMSKKSLLNSLQPASQLSMIPVAFQKVLVDSGSPSIAILLADGKSFGIKLNDIEGAMLIYIQSKCPLKPAVPNVYDHAIAAEAQMHYALDCAVIEAIEGDLVLGRLAFKDDRGMTRYRQCSGGDTIIYTRFQEAKLFITRIALDTVDPLNWNSMQGQMAGYFDE